MPDPLFRLFIYILFISAIVFQGCAGSQPSRFYVLTSQANPAIEENVEGQGQMVSIGLGPVELPLYLDRLQIVNRPDPNELKLADFDLWGEPLEENFSRVLAENLSAMVPTDRMVMYPWKRSAVIDYQVAVKVTRFDGVLGGENILVARWTLFGKDGKEELMSKKSSFSKTSSEGSYAAMVFSLNETLADLSQEIASAIKNQKQTRSEK